MLGIGGNEPEQPVQEETHLFKQLYESDFSPS
jgi:hypothetical protein